jgi:hypothetical protein
MAQDYEVEVRAQAIEVDADRDLFCPQLWKSLEQAT